MQLALKYTLFAAIATVVNLLTQEVVVQVYRGGEALYYGILAGTLTGLICKFLLDKRHIFHFQSRSSRDDLNRFLNYGLTGIITTLIFWGFELGFEVAFASKFARYLGACIGLSIGYGIKYRLDKRFVFAS